MKGSFNKVYSHPIVVEEQQLRNLATIIIDRFVEVEYEVKTIDGSSYKFFTIEELIEAMPMIVNREEM